jgi:hypothetical protein
MVRVLTVPLEIVLLVDDEEIVDAEEEVEALDA